VDWAEEIHLFCGLMMSKSSGVKTFVVAVVSGTCLDLKFKIGQTGLDDGVDRSCSFKATEHECSSEEQSMNISKGALVDSGSFANTRLTSTFVC
jgi:hypothetical protein